MRTTTSIPDLFEKPNHTARVDALREHTLRAFFPNSFVSATFNLCGVSVEQGRKRIRYFLRDTERKLFGRNFHRLPARQRVDGIIFPEKIGINLHYHMCLRVPPTLIARFDDVAPKVWERVFDAGTIDIKHPTDIATRQKTISYSTKETHKDRNYESFILVREFWN